MDSKSGSSAVPVISMISPDVPEMGSRIDIVANSYQTIKLSKRRWAILFAMCVFGVTNNVVDDSSSILKTMTDLLDLPLKEFVYITQLFSFWPAFTTVPTGWFIDRYGIKTTMYLICVIILIRNSTKALLFSRDLPYWEDLRYIYWAITSMASVQAMTTFFCLPLNISEKWFSTSERSLAWTIMISASSVGFSMSAFFLPRYIHGVEDVKPLAYWNIGVAFVAILVIMLCITKSRPKYPPSERMIKSSAERLLFWTSIRRMIGQKDIMLHLITLSVTEALTIGMFTLMQDMLTSVGHSNIFVGNLLSINEISSMVTLIVLSSLVHRVKNITLICKIGSLLASITLLMFGITTLFETPGYIVIIFSLLHKVSIGWVIPNYNNMTANLASGIVSEATIAGISTMIAIVILSIYRVIFVSLVTVGYNGKSDYLYPIMFTCILSVVSSTSYAAFFTGKVKESEKS